MKSAKCGVLSKWAKPFRELAPPPKVERSKVGQTNSPMRSTTPLYRVGVWWWCRKSNLVEWSKKNKQMACWVKFSDYLGKSRLEQFYG